MMSITNPIAIGMKTVWIDSEYILEKEFTKLIHMNPSTVLYLTINLVESYHSCVCGTLT